MTNSEINKGFMDAVHPKVRARIIESIAERYGITQGQAFDEVTQPEAEHLLDYLTEPVRTATGVLMLKTRMVRK